MLRWEHGLCRGEGNPSGHRYIWGTHTGPGGPAEGLLFGPECQILQTISVHTGLLHIIGKTQKQQAN